MTVKIAINPISMQIIYYYYCQKVFVYLSVYMSFIAVNWAGRIGTNLIIPNPQGPRASYRNLFPIIPVLKGIMG